MLKTGGEVPHILAVLFLLYGDFAENCKCPISPNSKSEAQTYLTLSVLNVKLR